VFAFRRNHWPISVGIRNGPELIELLHDDTWPRGRSQATILHVLEDAYDCTTEGGRYMTNLTWRWTAVRETVSFKSNDHVTHAIIDSRLQALSQEG
jgi:hypothetical protein